MGATKETTGVKLRKPLTVNGNTLSAAEELRLLISNVDYCREGFFDRLTVVELVQLHRMLQASGWDMPMDTWTPRQVREALRGIPPKWDDDEKPVYAARAATPAAPEKAGGLCIQCGLPVDAPIHTGGHPTRCHAPVTRAATPEKAGGGR